MKLYKLLGHIHDATIPSAVPPSAIDARVISGDGKVWNIGYTTFDAETKEFFIHLDETPVVNKE